MSNLIATVYNTALVSRHDHLAVVNAQTIEADVHAASEILPRGTLLGKMASGNYRAYAEAVVKTGGAFSTSADTFTLDIAASPLAKHLRVGDTIEGLSADLGEIATFDPVTGVGTLTGNSASNLAAGQVVRIVFAECDISGGHARLLVDELICSGSDEVAATFMEGFFVKARTTITASAITGMGTNVYSVSSDEVRLK